MFLLNYSDGRRYEKNITIFAENEVSFKIYLWSRTMAHAIGLQSDYLLKLNNIEILQDLNDKRLKESDIICTCTASEEALISLKQVKKGVHINGN